MKPKILTSRFCGLLIPAFLLPSGCGKTALDPAKELIGRNVTIQFRRDALGGAASLPVSPFTSSINGAETCVAGKMEKVEEKWLVIQKGATLAWIPRDVVLAIEETDTRKK